VSYFQNILDNYAVFDEEKKPVLTGLIVVCVMNTRACDLHHYIEEKVTPIWGFSHWVPQMQQSLYFL
jgi:hypothetical protein